MKDSDVRKVHAELNYALFDTEIGGINSSKTEVIGRKCHGINRHSSTVRRSSFQILKCIISPIMRRVEFQVLHTSIDSHYGVCSSTPNKCETAFAFLNFELG